VVLCCGAEPPQRTEIRESVSRPRSAALPLGVVLRGSRALSAWFVCAVALAAVACPAASEPDVAIQSEGEGNHVTATLVDGLSVIDVRSERGIGSARVERRAGDLSGPLALQLGLRGLEELRFAYADVRVTASLGNGPDGVLQQSVVLGAEASAAERPIGPDSPYWLAVTRAGESIRVEVPRDFRERRVRSFSISWVDFFR